MGDSIEELIRKTEKALKRHDGYLEPWDVEDEFTTGEVFKLKLLINIFSEFKRSICFEEE